jgi:hypothetical protein
MQIRTTGGTRTAQKLIKDIAHFCADNLLSTRLSNTLLLKIEISDLGIGDIDGDCDYEEWDDYRPKEFTIRVNKNLRIYKQLRTIAHEMVHVKQYATGEMRYMWRPARHTKFNGLLYPESLNYWECPWEIEAFGREVGLYSRWVDAKGWTGNEIFDSRNVPDEIPQEEKELLGMK